MTQSIQIKRVKNGLEAIVDRGIPLLYRRGDPGYHDIERWMSKISAEIAHRKAWKPRGGVDY